MELLAAENFRVLEVLSSLGMMLVVVLALVLLQRLLQHRHGVSAQRRLGPQIVMLAGCAIAVIVVIVTLPISDGLRGQLFGLLGVALTAVIALSSTAFVSNAMAGLMLRAVRNFQTGDFVRVGDQFGRVTVRGLFHVEIQTADRDLTTLPNLFLVSNPVTVVRSSGTIISTEVSLGYDVAHGDAENSLLRAAADAGLSEPFVHVVSLGDSSVTYRVAGFLADTSRLITARSRLGKATLDALHADGIEIVSPNFMNQRALDPAVPVVPEKSRPRWQRLAPERAAVEDLVFDKADAAANLESLEHEKVRLAGELKQLGAEDPARAGIEERLAEVDRELALANGEDEPAPAG